MAAPVKPIVEPEPKPPVSPTPAIQKTQTDPGNQPTNHPGLIEQSAILAELRKINEDNRSLRAEIDLLKKTPEPPKPDFFKDPAAHFESVAERLEKKLGETVQPLIDFKNRVEAGDALTSIKTKLRAANPKINEFLSNPAAEAALNQMLSGRASVSENDVIVAVAGVRGAIELGMIPGITAPTPGNPAPTPTPKREIDVSTIPPHLRPSAAPGPNDAPDPNKPERELSENESRLAREQGLSHAEYLELMKAHPLDVIKPKKKEGK